MPDYSRILYLSPSPQGIKEARRIFHKLLSDKAGTYVPPLMLTPAQLAKKLCQPHGGRLIFPSYLKVPVMARLSSKKGLPGGIGHASLLSDFISETKGRFPGKKASQLKQEVFEPAIEELGIPDEVGLRLIRALDLMEAYDSFLAENEFIDPGDSFVHARGLMEERGFEIAVLDGFYELTEAERILIREILELTSSSIALVPDEKYGSLSEEYISFLKEFGHSEKEHPSNIPVPLRYFAYPSREEEVEAVARKIKASHISRTPGSELSGAHFVFPSGTDYADMAERVFSRYGVPYAFHGGRGGRNSLRKKRAQDLMSVFQVFGDESPRAIARLLSSPLFTNIPEALRGFAPKITLRGITDGLDEILIQPDAPEEDFKRLKRRLSPLRKKPENFSGFVKKYLEVLRGLGFDADEELETRLKSLALLDSLGPPKGDEFKETLSFLIGSLPDEEEGAGVLIMPFGADAARLEPESLYFAGMRDGVIPRRPELDLFLPEKLRAKLGLATMKTVLLKEEFLFKKLFSSSKKVHLSFAEMEGEKVFIPSIFISEGQRVKEPVYGIFSKEEELLRKGFEKDPYGASIKEIEVKGRKPGKLRVTDIDAYRNCPRLFYMEKIMGLSPLEPAKYEVEPKITGTIAHKVMERLSPIRETSIEELNKRAAAVLDGVLRDEPLQAFWRDLLKESFLSILPEILEMEKKLKEEGYSFHRAELKLESSLKGVILSGKVDRIDRREDGTCQIIDYKTGRLDLAGKEILEKGANLQLLLYAEMAKRAGVAPSRVGIYSLKDLNTKFIPARSDIKAGRTLQDYIEKALSWLEETVDHIKTGDFPARPLSDQACRRCHEKPYCPYIHSPEKRTEAPDGQ